MTVTVTSALAGPATARYSNVYGALVDLGVLSGLGAQDVTGSGDPVAPILNASEFYAPLTHSLVLTRGTGSATFTRATKAWEFGYSAAANAGADQVLIEVATGTPRFGGARYDAGTWYNTYADGSAISASSLLGYHAEGVRTNNLLYSRDLTNAAWAATNITPAKTATGVDNAANSASTLTAGAADATILQTLTLAAAARSFSAYVKRRTGSGNIYITRDGGTTWTDVTSQINSTTWTRVKIENTSVLNPQVGFKIATSGDAIDVDVCQDEAGAFISSPIITTTAAVTRNAEDVYYPSANIGNATGSVLFNVMMEPTTATARMLIACGTASTRRASGSAPTTINFNDSTNEIQKTGLTDMSTGSRKRAFSYTGASASITGDGAAVATGSFDGSFGANNALRIGNNGDGTSLVYGYMKDVYIWSTALTDAQLQQVTA